MWVTGPPGHSLTLKTSRKQSVPIDPTQTAHAEAAGRGDRHWAELAGGGVSLTFKRASLSPGYPCTQWRRWPESAQGLMETNWSWNWCQKGLPTQSRWHTCTVRGEAITARFAISSSSCYCRSAVTVWIVGDIWILPWQCCFPPFPKYIKET